MDFNTGGSGGQNPNDPSRPLFGGESPRTSPSGPTGGIGGEFTLSDPVGSFVRTSVSVVTQPTNFFRGMVRQGNFANPMVFALILLGNIYDLEWPVGTLALRAAGAGDP